MKKFDRQEVFDTVLTHLRKQGRASTVGYGECAYRGIGGDMCAVGCLIPDELYDPEIEAKGVHRHLVKSVLGRIYSDINLSDHGDDILFLGDLQNAHDKYMVSDVQSWSEDMEGMRSWEKCMKGIANRFNLQYTAP